MKRKSIFKVILTAIVVALTFPVAVLFSACDQNPPAPCEVIFCIDGRKEKTAEVAKNASLSVDEANALYNETRTGYTLDGWYTDSAMTQRFEGVAKVEDKVVLYGTYNINSYTLRFVFGNGQSDVVSTLEYQAEITAPDDPIREGYDFVGWDKDIPATMPAEDLTISANWQVQSYLISFVFNNGQEDYEDVLDYGAPIVAPADPTLEGYTFMGWSPEVPATMPAEDMTFEAVWKINQYTITFDTDGGSLVDPITQNYNTTISAPADPERIGYTFAGWLPAVPSTMPSQNMTCVAQWTPIDYTLRFMLNNEEDDIVSIMHYGDPIVAPTGFVKTGHSFAGWDPKLPATMPNQSVTYCAMWTVNSYTITFDTVDGTPIDPMTQHYGSSIVAPDDPTKTGYTFTGWDKPIPATMPAEDMTITAQWQIKQFTITFDCNGGSPDIEPITNDYGAAVTPPQNPTKEGYTFAGWAPICPDTMPAEDRTCVAQWTINKHTVTYDMAGKLDNIVQTHEYGEVLTLIDNPTHEGYEFSVWDIALPETMPDYNVVLRAVWNAKQFSITYVLGNGEQDIVDPWKYGEEVVAPANPTRAGYTFAGWDTPIPTTMPAQNLVRTAQWTPNSITITFDSNEGTPVDPITQDCGTPVAGPIADPTKTGYTFAGWYEDNGAFNYQFVFPNTMPTENKTLYAKWTAVGQITVTFEVDGVQYYQYADYAGEPLVGPANNPTKTGYTFAGWTPEVPATMPNSDTTYTAEWTIQQYTITFNSNGGSAVASITQDYDTAVVAPTAPTRDYYTFAGWTPEVPTTMPAENVTCVANWTPVEYHITFDEDGGVAVSDLTYTIETPAFALPTTTKTGYSFAGWWIGETQYETITIGSHGDLALTAHWTLDTYSITYNLAGGTNGANPANYTIESATITLADATKDDYDFAGWYNNSDLAIEHQVTEIAQGSTGNVELWAKWTLHNYAISYDLGEGGVNNPNNPSTFTVESGTIHLQNPTRPGYTFGGWIRGGSAINTIVCANEHADISVMAVWTIQQYTLTFVFDNGYSDIVVNNIQYGTELNYKTYLVDEAHLAPSKRGYTFQTFEDEDETDWTEIETMPGHDLVFTAVYELDSDMEMFTFTATHDTCVITGIVASKKANIEQVFIPGYVTEIKDGAFAGCPSLTLLDLPFVGRFPNAASYTDPTFVDGLWMSVLNVEKSVYEAADTTIYAKQSFYKKIDGSNVYYYYLIPKTLTSLILHPTYQESTTTFANNAFWIGTGSQTNLPVTTIYFAGTIANWCSISFGAQAANPMYPSVTTHFKYLPDPTNVDYQDIKKHYVELTTLTTPTTGTEIKQNTFVGFTCLTTLIITDNITKVGSGAFKGCSSLQTIIVPTSVINIASEAFANCHANCTVYYMGDATQWSAIKGATNKSDIDSNINGMTRYYYVANESDLTPEMIAEHIYWHYNDQGQPELWPQ